MIPMSTAAPTRCDCERARLRTIAPAQTSTRWSLTTTPTTTSPRAGTAVRASEIVHPLLTMIEQSASVYLPIAAILSDAMPAIEITAETIATEIGTEIEIATETEIGAEPIETGSGTESESESERGAAIVAETIEIEIEIEIVTEIEMASATIETETETETETRGDHDNSTKARYHAIHTHKLESRVCSTSNNTLLLPYIVDWGE